MAIRAALLGEWRYKPRAPAAVSFGGVAGKPMTDASALAVAALADQIDAVCDALVADESVVLTALCRAIARRAVRLAANDEGALRAVVLLSQLIGAFAAAEFAIILKERAS